MTFDLNGFQDFLETAESAQLRERENIRLGRTLVTAREVGIFYPPETPARIMNQKIWTKPTLQEWELSAAKTQARLQELVTGDTAPANEESTSPFPTINLTT